MAISPDSSMIDSHNIVFVCVCKVLIGVVENV